MSRFATRLQRSMHASELSIWSNAYTPAVIEEPDYSSIELGLKFQSSVPTYVVGIRFYKSINNTGVHIGNLWTLTGTNIATVTFSGETASGWQEQRFNNPISIAANTTYVISYFAHNGAYSADSGYFASTGTTHKTLTALSDAAASGNGLYAYNGTSTFPTNSYGQTNYWVDVITSTDAVSDVTPPTTPTNLVATPNNTFVSLTWTASTDTSGVARYSILRDGVPVGASTTPSYTDNGLTPSTTYTYTVIAYDTYNNASTASSPVNATTTNDTTPPSVPIGLIASVVSATEMSVSWQPSTDNSAVDHYEVYRDGTLFGTTTVPVYLDSSVTAGTTYTYTAKAVDTVGNTSALSSGVSAQAGTMWTLSAWPDATNTGYAHTGVTLQTLTDTSSGTGWYCANTAGTSMLYVTVDNTIIDSLDIDNRYLKIMANNVTVKRCRIRNGGYYSMFIGDPPTEYSGLTVEDCEIDGLNDTTNFTVCINASLFATFRRCDIHGMASSGPRLTTGNLMEDCYLHDYVHGTGGHEAGISTNSSDYGVVIRHNNISINTAGASSAIAQYRDFGVPYDQTVRNNLINGGNYGIFSAITDSGNTFSPTHGMRYISNTLGREFNPECGFYGPVAGFSYTNGLGNRWEENVWGDGLAADATHAVGDQVDLGVNTMQTVKHGDQLTLAELGPWNLQSVTKGSEVLSLTPAAYFSDRLSKYPGTAWPRWIPNQTYVYNNNPSNHGGIVPAGGLTIDGRFVPEGTYVVQFADLSNGQMIVEGDVNGAYPPFAGLLVRGCRWRAPSPYVGALSQNGESSAGGRIWFHYCDMGGLGSQTSDYCEIPLKVGASAVRVYRSYFSYCTTAIQGFGDPGTEIIENYIERITTFNTSGPHLNGITFNGGDLCARVERNYVILQSPEDNGSNKLVDQTDCISFFQDFGDYKGTGQNDNGILGYQVLDNYMGGGGYCLYAGMNSGQTATSVNNMYVTGNKITTQWWTNGGAYNTCAAQPVWGSYGNVNSNNIWADDYGSGGDGLTLPAGRQYPSGNGPRTGTAAI